MLCQGCCVLLCLMAVMRKALGNSTNRCKEIVFFVLMWFCSTYRGGLPVSLFRRERQRKLNKVEVIEIFLGSYLFKDLIVFCNTF